MSKVKIDSGAVFERHEKKYLVHPSQYACLSERLEPYMARDRYGLHTICSLYYDTDDYSIIRNSLDKPKFKEKLRLRAYGTPGEMDAVYIELKKKFDGVTYKRRIRLPLCEARAYLNDGAQPSGADPQILGEINWFLTQKRPSAKVLLCYDRIALFGRENPNLRITFDADIRWRTERLNPSLGDYGTQLIGPGERVMEIKTTDALPLWLCDVLSGLELYPQSFSKYGTVYREYLMDGKGSDLRHAG